MRNTAQFVKSRLSFAFVVVRGVNVLLFNFIGRERGRGSEAFCEDVTALRKTEHRDSSGLQQAPDRNPHWHCVEQLNLR